jgi:hypothetical protein
MLRARLVESLLVRIGFVGVARNSVGNLDHSYHHANKESVPKTSNTVRWQSVEPRSDRLLAGTSKLRIIDDEVAEQLHPVHLFTRHGGQAS